MEIRKHFLLLYIFMSSSLLVGDNHLATEFVTDSKPAEETSEAYSNTHMTRLIQEQVNGTVNLCSEILGTKWKNDINKTLHPNASEPFIVCVPRKAAFPEFIDVGEDGKLKGGFSIALFCLTLQELPFKIQHVFKLIENTESYDEVVQKLEGQECDVVAGDITITSNRTKYADFTIAYMSSKIYMLVPAKQSWKKEMLTLFKPFTMRLWITIIIACVIIGISIGYLEYRAKNPSFYNVSFFQKLFMIISFPVLKIFFQEEKIHNRWSKVVLVTWFITIFIVMQVFTAGLSSWLVGKNLQPKVPKPYQDIGYQNGSYILDFLENHAQSSGTNLTALALSSVEAYKSALDGGKVGAICDEDPYIDIFLSKYADDYMKNGPMADEPGLGFAFPRGSPLQQSFSNAIIKITESPYMAQLKESYLGIKNFTTQADDNTYPPSSLDVQSFFLLFLFMGFTITMAIISSELSLMHTGNTSNDLRETMHTDNAASNESTMTATISSELSPIHTDDNKSNESKETMHTVNTTSNESREMKHIGNTSNESRETTRTGNTSNEPRETVSASENPIQDAQ